MGFNNRAWVNDIDYDDSCEWTYKHVAYLGGEMSFDVNVSQVDCMCAFGVHLAYLNDNECRLNAYQPSELNPACDTISLMESNKQGFISSTQECVSGVCTDAKQCMAGLYPQTGYGPGDRFTINSEQDYNVKFQFFVDQDKDTFEFTGLTEIRTTLTQNGEEVTFNQETEGSDCRGIYDSLFLRLQNEEMALAFSSYDVGSHSELDTACLGTCSSSMQKLTNLTWRSNTALNPIPDDGDDTDMGEYIVTEKPSATIGMCAEQKDENGNDCTECKEAFYELDPDTKYGECTNWIQYRYG